MLHFLAIQLLACGGGPSAEVALDPIAWKDAECAVCGMVVGEQPAPRGQIAWRDGSRSFACSLGDLRAAAQTPDPRGRPQAVWVEALPAADAPLAEVRGPLPWLRAESASFVVGVQRPGVMGHPVLAYASLAQARAAAVVAGGRLATWEALSAVPFHEVPPGEAP